MDNQIEIKRHSLAHVLAEAVEQIYGKENVKLGFWPAIENGFYHDFDLWKIKISDSDLKEIEKKMKNIISQSQKIEKYELPIDEATNKYKWVDEYRLENIEKLKNQWENKVCFYKNIDQKWEIVFENLCSWPHVENTNKLDKNAFCLEKVAWAYWLWDEKNPMLTRIYGFAFETQEELQNHLKMLEEAKKRDHRILWKKLELFTFDDDVWPWLPLWLPAWAILTEELETLAKKMEEKYWYQRVKTPHIAKDKLYLKSWHLPYYEKDMFPSMEFDNEKYYLKAMNCPHHHKLYDAIPKSYKDLPVRFAEYWHCYRYEDSGSLFGLMRVRSMCMNDAHIYCSEEQFEEEFIKVIEMYKYYFNLFWIEKYEMRLSKHDKEGLWKKYINNEKLWIKTEEQVRSALLKSWVPFVEAEWEWAFYWPKIDVQIWSAIWREFTLATNQLDFAVPWRFNLTYKDKNWEDQTPICIHRAPLSTHERFIGFLIEHFAWVFPLWLAPRQVVVIPVWTDFIDYATKIYDELKSQWIRVSLDESWDSLNKKIRNAEKLHINYILVVWAEEEKNKSISVRNYKTKEQNVEKVDNFLKNIKLEISEKKL